MFGAVTDFHLPNTFSFQAWSWIALQDLMELMQNIYLRPLRVTTENRTSAVRGHHFRRIWNCSAATKTIVNRYRKQHFSWDGSPFVVFMQWERQKSEAANTENSILAEKGSSFFAFLHWEGNKKSHWRQVPKLACQLRAGIILGVFEKCSER